jgi:hypothetical protein
MRKEELAYSKGYRVDELGFPVSFSGTSLKPDKMHDGYLRIKASNGLVRFNVMIHRLQAYQKYGNLIYAEGVEVRHMNGNKFDNSFGNVLIGTHSENMMDVPVSVRISSAIHASSFRNKYNWEEVKLFYINNGKSYHKTIEKFGMSRSSLRYILNK